MKPIIDVAWDVENSENIENIPVFTPSNKTWCSWGPLQHGCTTHMSE